MIDKRMFDSVFLEAITQLREKAPKDTGNLRYNAIKYRWLSDTRFEIYVDVGDTTAFTMGEPLVKGQAPYMPFTNEEWISPRWNGKKNPNQNWWNEAMELVIKFIAKRMGGLLSRNVSKEEIGEF